MSHRILVTLCTYNERENISKLVPLIRQTVPAASVLIVDDSSPDGTGDLGDEMAASDPQVIVLHRRERGLGGATIAAFRFAAENNFDRVVNLDADFSHPPERIPALLERLDQEPQVDVCIGSRYVPGGEIEGWPLKRHVMSQLVNCYARTILGLPIRDTSGSFRAYRGELLRSIDFDGFRSLGYSVQQEMLFHCMRAGARFAELPICFKERVAGASKIRLREGWKVLTTLAALRISKRNQQVAN